MLGASGAQFLRIVAFISMAPILGPEAYGLIGVASLLSAPFDLLLIYAGWSESVLREKSVDRLELSSLFWLHIAIGIAAIPIFLLAAPFLQVIFSSSELGIVVILLSVGPLLQGASIVPRIILIRQISFRAIAVIDVVSTVLGFVFALVLALNNQGVYSLVALQLGIHLSASFFLVLKTRFLPKIRLQFSEIDRFFSVSKNLMLINLTRVVEQMLIRYLVGTAYGIASLGSYVFARRIFEVISLGSVSAINRVGLVHLTKEGLTISEKLKITYQVLFYGIMLTWPVFLMLIFAGSKLVKPVAGEDWQQGMSLMFWICLTGMTLPVIRPMKHLLLALGRESWLITVEGCWSIILIISVCLVVQANITLTVIVQILFYRSLLLVLSYWTAIYRALK